MDYRMIAAEELRCAAQLRAAYENIGTHMHELEHEMTAARTAAYDREQTGKKRKNGNEDHVAALLSRKEALDARRTQIGLRLVRIARAASVLRTEERAVLDAFFSRVDSRPEDVAAELRLEKSALYRLRAEALEHFTRALYGIVLT